MKKYFKLLIKLTSILTVSALIIFSTINKENSVIKSEEINIALIYSDIGTYSNYANQLITAVELAEKYINSNGGINNKKLNIDMFDCQNNPQTAEEIARFIVKENSYMCVISYYNNNCMMTTSPIFEKNKIVQITPISDNMDFASYSEYQFSFATSRSENSIYDGTELIKNKLSFDSVGIIYINNNWTIESLRAFEKEAELASLNIRIEEPISKEQTNFKPIITRMIQTKPDCIYIIADYNETVKIIEEVKTSRWDVPIIVTSSFITDMTKLIPEKTLKNVIGRQYKAFNDNNKEREEFIYNYRHTAEYSDMEFGMLSYDIVKIISKTVENCGNRLTLKRFKEEFLKSEDFNGILGNIEFDKNGTAVREFNIIKY